MIARRTTTWALASCIAVGSITRVASAQERCPAVDGGSPELAAQDASARLAFVRGVMHDQARYAHTWTLAWSVIGVGIAAGEYGLMALPQAASKRQEDAVVGTSAFYIPLSIAVLPLAVRADDEALERRVAMSQTASGVMSSCLVLARAEELFAHTAANESERTAVLPHVFNVVLDAGYAGVLWLLFRDPGGVVFNGVSAVALGEAQILTLPTGAVGALERYKRGELARPGASPVAWSLGPAPVGTGVSVVATF